MQLAIGEVARVARLALEADRDPVAALVEVHVEAVVRHVEHAVREPAVMRRTFVVERDGEWLAPAELPACEIAPEARVIRGRARVHRLEIGGLDPRACGEIGRRIEATRLVQDGFQLVLAHVLTPPEWRDGWNYRPCMSQQARRRLPTQAEAARPGSSPMESTSSRASAITGRLKKYPCA